MSHYFQLNCKVFRVRIFPLVSKTIKSECAIQCHQSVKLVALELRIPIKFNFEEDGLFLFRI